MLERPRLRCDLSVAVVGARKLFISDRGRHSLLEDAVAAQLSPLLDGERTVAELMEALNTVPVGRVLGALSALERLGYLVNGSINGDRASAAFWDANEINPLAASERLVGAAVAVTTVGPASSDRVEQALSAAGLRVAPEADVNLVITQDYLSEGLAEINRRHLASGSPWLLAKVTGTELWLGPWFHADGACWACLAERLRENRQLERYLVDNQADHLGPLAEPALASTIDAGASLVAAELQTIIAAGRSPRVDGQIITLDLRSLETVRHAVIRQPHCPACSGASAPARRSSRVTLAPQIKRYTDDGGHRVSGPHETFARLEKHISPITGAVTSLRSQNVEDNGVAYSYAAGHNFALMQDSTFFLRKNLRGRSGGKGRTDTQARVGAVCEAIERFNGIYRDAEPATRASYATVADRAVHPEELLLFSDEQYAGRGPWNAAQQSSYHIVPDRLDPDHAIDWTAAWSLTGDRERLVPSAYCWFGHPDARERFFCASDANGNAAGNTVEEAVLQGLLELVERDAVAIWWYNRLRRPAFALDALNEPYVDLVRAHYQRINRNLWLLDLTTDLGIPVFCAVSQRLNGPTEDLLIGFGAHLDVRTAALRALTELNQFLPAVTEINPDGTTRYWMDDPDAIAWWTTARLQSNPYLRAADTEPSQPAAFEALATDDLAEDVRRCVGLLEAAGHEVLVLDQTRPDIELAVVKVMAPGLRHFWRRLGKGRLYDAPVRLGWLDAPHAEPELNPLSIFF